MLKLKTDMTEIQFKKKNIGLFHLKNFLTRRRFPDPVGARGNKQFFNYGLRTPQV
jgi:hypothetical protein